MNRNRIVLLLLFCFISSIYTIPVPQFGNAIGTAVKIGEAATFAERMALKAERTAQIVQNFATKIPRFGEIISNAAANGYRTIAGLGNAARQGANNAAEFIEKGGLAGETGSTNNILSRLGSKLLAGKGGIADRAQQIFQKGLGWVKQNPGTAALQAGDFANNGLTVDSTIKTARTDVREGLPVFVPQDPPSLGSNSVASTRGIS